jgi:hypothetical protein
MTSENEDALPMPPVLVHPKFEMYSDEPVYDPDIHLQLTEPDFVVLLDGFQRVPKAPRLDRPTAPNGDSQLAYTGPFQVLSNEGYQVLRNLLQRELVYQQGDARLPAYIRNGGYRSKWLQDFNRCPRVLQHLSHMTGDVRLLPTALQLNYSTVNVGYATGQNVDSFHCDSVPYVLILLACDMSQTDGGELQLMERDPKEAFKLIEQYKGNLPTEIIRPIDYLGSNSCVFMQGKSTNTRLCRDRFSAEPFYYLRRQSHSTSCDQYSFLYGTSIDSSQLVHVDQPICC